MLWTPFFLLVTLGGCYYGNTVKGFVIPFDGLPPGTPHSTPVTTTEEIATTPRIGKQQATDPLPTRATIGNLGHSIIEQPTTTGDAGLVTTTTGKQTAPASVSPKATILAITIPVCVLLLLLGAIFILVCLVIRNRKRRLEVGGEISDKNGGGWRDRLASHVHPKRKDTRCNADDNHPRVVYNVKEGHARSFIHTPSFSEMPPLSAAAHIENEAIDFKDSDAILEQSETDEKLAGNGEVDTVRGFENIGYLPESPQVHAKRKSARSSRHLGVMAKVSSGVHSTGIDTEDFSGESQRPAADKHRNSGGGAAQNTIPTAQSGEDPARERNTRKMTQKEGLPGLEVDISIDADDEISARSSDSSGSSLCGYWAPNAEADDGDVAEKGNERSDGASSSGEDVASTEDAEPPYSTWPVRKTSTQLSESGSDVSLIEPIGSEEEEDPYDTIVPGAPVETNAKNVKPKIKCINALDGQFSDSDGDVHDEGTCEDKDCKSCRGRCAHDFDDSRVSRFDMDDDVEVPIPDFTSNHKVGGAADEEESPYDTLPAGRPRSVEHVDEADSEGVKERSPTYTTVPNDVLGPSFKERVETFFVENVSSSEESLADEGEFGMDTKRMSLEISDLTNEIEGQGQGHLEGQGQIEDTDDSFVFVGEGGVDSLKSV